MKNKVGLILSHFFVREGEGYKWPWVEKSIDKHRELYQDFHIVLSGHGQPPPAYILNKIDDLYWENQIKEIELGKGHPHFSIKGYEACFSAGCEKTLKNVAFNWLEHDKAFDYDLVFCSTNTDFKRKLLGDLLIFGNTGMMLDLWSCRPWDYKLRDGLVNLYHNMTRKWGSELWIKENAKFLSSKELGWITMNDYRGNGPKYWAD